MARTGISSSNIDSKKKMQDARNVSSSLKEKRFEELNHEEKMLLLKILAEGADLIKRG